MLETLQNLIHAPLSEETRAIVGLVGASEEAPWLGREWLQQAQNLEAVGRLASGIAHAFNNILMVITGHCELSLESADGALRTSLQKIAGATRRAASLTAQLLAFGRKLILQPRVISPKELVTEMSAVLHRIGRILDSDGKDASRSQESLKDSSRIAVKAAAATA